MINVAQIFIDANFSFSNFQRYQLWCLRWKERFGEFPKSDLEHDDETGRYTKPKR